MSTTYPGQKSSLVIPRLLAQVNNYHSGSVISNLQHGHPSADPTTDGLFDWVEPNLTLFTRNMSPEILALNPVVVLSRYLPKARNSSKNGVRKNTSTKRWVIPGNKDNNGLSFHGGDSSTNRAGQPKNQVPNFLPIQNNSIVGYNHVLFDGYTLPINNFVVDRQIGLYYAGLNRAIYSSDWNDYITYTQHRVRNNYFMKFQLFLAVPNPKWTNSNHQNKWIFGEGQTIIVEPRLQTFNDGSGPLEYYIGWKAKVVN